MLCCLLLGLFRHVHVLEIFYSKENKRVFYTKVSPGDRFALENTHSVQLSQVEDSFEISQDYKITLVDTTFSDHGAGLPHTLCQGGSFSIQADGRFNVSGMKVILPEILLRVMRDYSNIFTFNGQRINLSKRYGDALLKVCVNRYSISGYFLRRIMDVG